MLLLINHPFPPIQILSENSSYAGGEELGVAVNVVGDSESDALTCTESMP